MKDKEILQVLLDGETIKIHRRMYEIRKNGTGDVLLENGGQGWECIYKRLQFFMFSYERLQFFLNNDAEAPVSDSKRMEECK